MMDAVFDFIHAVLPWMATGLLLAVFFAGSTYRKKEKCEYDDCGIQGMCLGMCVGSAVGASGAVSIGTGLPFGMLIGLAVGTCIKKRERDTTNDKD